MNTSLIPESSDFPSNNADDRTVVSMTAKVVGVKDINSFKIWILPKFGAIARFPSRDRGVWHIPDDIYLSE